MKKTNLIKTGLLIALGGALVACGGTASSETSTGSSASEFDTSKTIKTYTRDRTSGTRDGFSTGIGLEDAKTDNTPLVDGVVEVSSNGDMMTKVANDEYGIGYISLSTLLVNLNEFCVVCAFKILLKQNINIYFLFLLYS